MTWYPSATKDAVPLRDSQKSIKPVGLVLHTAVSNSSHLRPTGTVRWHHYLNKEGKLYQYFDHNVSAACQRDGNRWYDSNQDRYEGFISLESWDGAGTSVWPDYNTNHSGGPAWNKAQVDSIVKLIVFLNKQYGVPIVKATGPQGAGIGFHRQFTGKGDDIRWNTSHACPGNKRAAQVPGIIAAAKKLAALPVTPPKPKPPVEDDLPTPNDVWNLKFLEYIDENGNLVRDSRTVADILFSAHQHAVSADKKADANTAKLNEILSILGDPS